MKQDKIYYIEPETVVTQVITEGFMNTSIQEVKMYMEVDEYKTYDEVQLDVL